MLSFVCIVYAARNATDLMQVVDFTDLMRVCHQFTSKPIGNNCSKITCYCQVRATNRDELLYRLDNCQATCAFLTLQALK